MNRRRGIPVTVIIGIVMALFAVIKYYSNSSINEFTGEKQHLSMTIPQEIELGLASRGQMAQQHGGLHPDQEAQELVDYVGAKLLRTTAAGQSPFQFEFHLLTDDRTVNAFALPGGQVFITAALYGQLQNEDQLAGVLGHEMGHVLARHGAERFAKTELTQGLTGAAVIASGDYGTAQAAQMIGNMINMKYGRDQELQSDDIGVRLMLESGYNPEEMIGVMAILKSASGGRDVPEFNSTHPSPENRVEKIREAIRKYGGSASLPAH